MKKLIFFISLSMLILVGCERYERTIWVNPDVECCGVKDPLNNLEWLKEWYSGSYFNANRVLYESCYWFIYVFENKETSENFIVFKDNEILTEHPYFVLYSCDGKIIDKGNYYDLNSDYANPNIQFVSPDSPIIVEPIPCPSCKEFFENHVLIDTIAYFYTDNLKK
ncbi:MAG: hypothetical protein IKV26_05260 [Paludibacteraceae bacterium]|nr:hypothetical protein [Paludibacteraceae bacterium]